MKYIITASILVFSSFSASTQDYFEDTIDNEKYETLYESCKAAIESHRKNSNEDIAVLYETLLRIQSSKNCDGIESFSAKELGRSRGAAAPCSVVPDGELTDISFGKIGLIQLSSTSGTPKTLSWDTDHINKMTSEKYIYEGTQGAKPFVNQLISQGICKNLQTKPKDSKKSQECKITLDSINIDEKGNFEIAFTDNGSVKHKLTDDDGMVVSNLILQKYIEQQDTRTQKKDKSAIFSETDKLLLIKSMRKMQSYFEQNNRTYNPEIEKEESADKKKKFATDLENAIQGLSDDKATVGDMDSCLMVVEEYKDGSFSSYLKNGKYQSGYELDGKFKPLFQRTYLEKKSVSVSGQIGKMLNSKDLTNGNYLYPNDPCPYYSIDDNSGYKPSSENMATPKVKPE